MAAAEDLRIIGVKVGSRDAAGEIVERLDQMVEAGRATIREMATVFKRPDGRVKVRYLHSHAVLIGAVIGVAVGVGGLTIATGRLLWAASARLPR